MVIGHLSETSEYKLMPCCSGGEPGGFLMGRTRCAGEWVRSSEYAVIQILIITTMSCTHVCRGQLLPGVFPSFSCCWRKKAAVLYNGNCCKASSGQVVRGQETGAMRGKHNKLNCFSQIDLI